MWLAEPDSPQARAADQQWMLGDDMLVAPVVVEGATSREVYFPEGCWEDPNSQRRFSGPTTATVSAPLDVLPHFFRCRKRGECLARPQPGCGLPRVSATSRLDIEDETQDTRDVLRWTWAKGAETMRSELGDPITTDDYFLCLYDAGVRVSSISLPAGGLCAGKPCWKTTSTGFVYENHERTPDGAQSAILKAGVAGKASMKVRGKGINLETPNPTSFTGPITVQIQQADGALSFETTFSAPFEMSTRGRFADVAD